MTQRIKVKNETLAIGKMEPDSTVWKFENARLEFGVAFRTGTVTLWIESEDDSKMAIDFTPNQDLLEMMQNAVKLDQKWEEGRADRRSKLEKQMCQATEALSSSAKRTKEKT